MIDRTTINEADWTALEDWAERVAALMLVDTEAPFPNGGFFLRYDDVTRFQSGKFAMLGIRFVRRPLATGTKGWTIDAEDAERALVLMKQRAPERVHVKLRLRSDEERCKLHNALNEYRYHLAQVYLQSGELYDAEEELRCITKTFSPARKSALRLQIRAAMGQ